MAEIKLHELLLDDFSDGEEVCGLVLVVVIELFLMCFINLVFGIGDEEMNIGSRGLDLMDEKD